MREMGIHGFCPGPNLSKRLHKKYLYPYLLRGLNINRPNQVWSVDVTYCRMKRGFMYMVAIIDWHSRYIVGYALSNTLERTFIIEAIKKAIKRYGTPEIINSDQGSPAPPTINEQKPFALDIIKMNAKTMALYKFTQNYMVNNTKYAK
ncbi:MAG: putative transposase [Clostridiales bacterium]|nr:putative transposase [Clostridiales bacterium]MDK2934282.1 putative transposase [Clostridiales bacterium]